MSKLTDEIARIIDPAAWPEDMPRDRMVMTLSEARARAREKATKIQTLISSPRKEIDPSEFYIQCLQNQMSIMQAVRDVLCPTSISGLVTIMDGLEKSIKLTMLTVAEPVRHAARTADAFGADGNIRVGSDSFARCGIVRINKDLLDQAVSHGWSLHRWVGQDEVEVFRK